LEILIEWIPKPFNVKIQAEFIFKNTKLYSMGWAVVFRFPAKARNVSTLYSFQTGSRANSLSSPVGKWGSFSGCKAAET
jgi:hypothetical protein